MGEPGLKDAYKFSWSHLSAKTRKRLGFLAISRVVVNLLDVAGIAGIGILTIQFLPSSGSPKTFLASLGVSWPELDERSALALATGILALFVTKSLLSILFTRITLRVLAQDENEFVSRMVANLPTYIGRSSTPVAITNIQMSLGLGSRSLFTGIIGTGLVIISEGSLLVMIAILLSVANLPASVLMFTFFGLVSFSLIRYSNSKVYNQVSQAEKATQIFNAELADFLGASQEIRLAGKASLWVKELKIRREAVNKSMISVLVQYSLPRHIIETALIAGIFLLLGTFVLFSDLASEAPTIGVLLAGSLRLTAALVPIQNSLNVLKTHHANARFAMELFENTNSWAPDSRIFTKKTRGPLQGEEIVKFDNVCFAVEGAPRERILENLNFVIRKGEKFAIVGPSGSGKSTIIKLLLGTIQPTSGAIEIVVDSTKDKGRPDKSTFSLVPQSPEVIGGGASVNITLDPSGGEISKQELDRALSMVHLSHVFNDSSDTIKNLSGGELQRLSIARALWTDSQIIVLDEATSALDANTESEISKTLQRLREDVTQVVIAHRLSTIKDADRILYLDEGRVVAIADFEELKKLVPDFEVAVSRMAF